MEGSNSLISPDLKSSQQTTMTLLTPDSFSSPNKPDDDPEGSNKVIVDLKSANNDEKSSNTQQQHPSATLSLLLRVGSGTLMPGSETSDIKTQKPININSILGSSSKLLTSSGASDSGPIMVGSDGILISSNGKVMKSSENENNSLSNILSTVISGSSRPSSRNSGIMSSRGDKQKDSSDNPLATSEVIVDRNLRGGSGGAASAASSPSLEVQQILHTQNG